MDHAKAKMKSNPINLGRIHNVDIIRYALFYTQKVSITLFKFIRFI